MPGHAGRWGRGRDIGRCQRDGAGISPPCKKPDIGSLQSNAMAAVKTDISAISSDVSAIRNLRATPSSDPSGTIAAGNKALTDAQNAIT